MKGHVDFGGDPCPHPIMVYIIYDSLKKVKSRLFSYEKDNKKTSEVADGYGLHQLAVSGWCRHQPNRGVFPI